MYVISPSPHSEASVATTTQARTNGQKDVIDYGLGEKPAVSPQSLWVDPVPETGKNGGVLSAELKGPDPPSCCNLPQQDGARLIPGKPRRG